VACVALARKRMTIRELQLVGEVLVSCLRLEFKQQLRSCGLRRQERTRGEPLARIPDATVA
jgi:hypothetical protein